MKKQLPNIVTLFNLFLGCVAVVSALEGRLAMAGIIIGICSVMDFLDGFLARILKAGSALGQQLDSLADLLSFGMAPAAIVFFYLQQTTQSPYLPFLAFLITVFSGLRLAIFNIDTRQLTSFIGLPTPANALFFASFPLVLAFAPGQGPVVEFLQEMLARQWALITLILVFSWLLVAPIRMFSLKFQSLKWKHNRIRFTFLIVSLVLFLMFQISSFFLIAIFYIILSIIQHFTIREEQSA